MPEPETAKAASWWQRLKAKVRALKEAVVAYFIPTPLPPRAFYVAARVVATTAGSLTAVVMWSVLSVSASVGPVTLLLVFAVMAMLLVAAAAIISREPGNIAASPCI